MLIKDLPPSAFLPVWTAKTEWRGRGYLFRYLIENSGWGNLAGNSLSTTKPRRRRRLVPTRGSAPATPFWFGARPSWAHLAGTLLWPSGGRAGHWPSPLWLPGEHGPRLERRRGRLW